MTTQLIFPVPSGGGGGGSGPGVSMDQLSGIVLVGELLHNNGGDLVDFSSVVVTRASDSDFYDFTSEGIKLNQEGYYAMNIRVAFPSVEHDENEYLQIGVGVIGNPETNFQGGNTAPPVTENAYTQVPALAVGQADINDVIAISLAQNMAEDMANVAVYFTLVRFGSVSGSGGDGGPVALSSLTDANVTDPQAGDFLSFIAGAWQNTPLNINAIPDFVIEDPQPLDVLMRIGGNWKNQPLPHVTPEELETAIMDLTVAYNAALNTGLSSRATPQDLDNLKSDLVNGAPAAFDTLLEISNQLATDEDAVAGLITTVATKETKGTAFVSALLFGGK